MGRNIKIDQDILNERAQRSIKAGYPKQKWIEFCETLLAEGYVLSLYEAKYTASKYITIKKGKKSFKVRFSNHRPNWQKEQMNDCDFFVGVSNNTVTTTVQALEAVHKYMEDE